MKIVYILLSILVSVSLLMAQDFQGAKIYINPGHGGNDPANDRYIQQTGFWESEGNLTKGLYLRDLLLAHNAQVFMSRTQNRDEDDLPLSTISADANANDVDIFHSIHSNAANATANYPLLLFHGYNGNPAIPGSDVLSAYVFQEMNRQNTHFTYWQNGYLDVEGDLTLGWWGSGGLGVLRGLNMPGALSEGSFHDYIPNSWRLMSIDYRKHESIVILRAMIDYYGLDPLPDGVIAGMVRDKNNTVSYNYNYNSGLPNDNKRTVNNAKVTLLPENLIYNVDFNNNGFYMFENVSPGEYQVVMEGGRYKPDTLDVTVTADRTVIANGYLESDGSKAPQVFAHTPAMNEEDVITQTDIEILFSQKMRRSTTEEALTLSPEINANYSWQDDDYRLIISLNDTLSRSTEYQVVITSDAENNLGVNLEEDYQFNFTTSASHVYPKILEFSPSDQTDSVFIFSDISVYFDTPMNTEKTENAFEIQPESPGSFTWNEDSTLMSFIPDTGLQRSTGYMVTLLESAENRYGVSLENTVSISFNTRQRNEVNLIASYPVAGSEEISPKLQFYAVFNGIIQTGTVLENIALKDGNGNNVAYRGLDVLVKNGKGIIVLEPRRDLTKNSEYTMYFYPGISDTVGLQVTDTIAIPFRTEVEPYASGTTVDDFEINFGWTDPDGNPVTSGTDDEKTTFSLSAFKNISGTYAGKLEYTFISDTAGICQLKNEEGLSITSEPTSDFGMWIYGDYSHNQLEFWFDYQGTSDAAVVIDTIDWAGWKMVTLPVAEIGASGNILFQSLVLRQLEESDTSGTIYLDDIQYDIIYTDIEPDPFADFKPVSFALEQNYPNPFNPSTTIRYQVPKTTEVTLSIYNLLGQKIKVLAQGNHPAGYYQVEWNAENVASGVYFYRLESTDGVVLTRKLVLMK